MRTRTVAAEAFASAARRVRAGLRFGVAARVEDERGRVLLVRMDPQNGWTRSWTLPGGGAERGERPRDAVRREIREEAGLEVADLRLWKVFHETVRSPSGESVRWDFLEFTARGVGGTLRPRATEEIAEARWFSRLPRGTEFRDDWLRPPRDRFSVRATAPVRARRV